MSIKDQRGLALTTVYLFTLILMFSWFYLSYIGSYESKRVQEDIATEQAFYVAETGIQQALYFLSQDWNWQKWPGNHIPGGTKVTQGNLTYYQWSGNLGDSNQTYTVQIRNDGETQSKIKVGSPNLNTPSRIIEVELGSAFDYGLYSHAQLSFSKRFTVSGPNRTGYVYAKGTISDLRRLTADKITGNDHTAPAPYYFFPKEIPLPYPGFRANIRGAPTSTSIQYTNDASEDSPGLAPGYQLYNKTKRNGRTIQSVDTSTNTITTQASNDTWASGDEIIDDFFQGDIGPFFSATIHDAPTSTVIQYTNDAGEGSPGLAPGYQLYNTRRDTARTIQSVDPSTNTITTQASNDTWANNDVIIEYITRNRLIQGDANLPYVIINNSFFYVTGSLVITQDLTGSNGGIIVSEDITINGQVTGGSDNSPFFIVTKHGNLTIQNALGTSGNPFSGLVYTGGSVLSINSINIGGGNIIANNFSGDVSNRNSSITNSNWKNWNNNFLNRALYFSKKDFIRPLLWKEKTE